MHLKNSLHVCLLSTHNLMFSKLFAQIIRLREQFPYHSIMSIHLDNNESEFSSRKFNDYCMAIGISMEKYFAHVHIHSKWSSRIIYEIPSIDS